MICFELSTATESYYKINRKKLTCYTNKKFFNRYHFHNTTNHVATAINKLNKTAKEPKSFANPDNG